MAQRSALGLDRPLELVLVAPFEWQLELGQLKVPELVRLWEQALAVALVLVGCSALGPTSQPRLPLSLGTSLGDDAVAVRSDQPAERPVGFGDDGCQRVAEDLEGVPFDAVGDSTGHRFGGHRLDRAGHRCRFDWI